MPRELSILIDGIPSPVLRKRRAIMIVKTDVTISSITIPAQIQGPALGTAGSWRDRAELLLVYAEPVSRAGLYVSLAIIYAWFGGMKFTDYEAKGLVPLVENSPLLSWFYDLLSVRGFSTFLGFVELCIGLLIAFRLVHPIFSA